MKATVNTLSQRILLLMVRRLLYMFFNLKGSMTLLVHSFMAAILPARET